MHVRASCLLATAKIATARLRHLLLLLSCLLGHNCGLERDDHMSAGSRPVWTGGLSVHCDDWPVHKASGGNSWPAPAAATTISDR